MKNNSSLMQGYSPDYSIGGEIDPPVGGPIEGFACL
jgi:hypothetical protein